MFSLSKVNREKLEAAVERAKEQKPRIHEKSFGCYTVLSSDGETRYQVEYKKLDGEIYASCNCKGSKGVCLHCASTLGHFKMRVNERAAAKAAAPAQTEAETLAAESDLYGG